jgi:hypothetical protein
MSQNSPKQWFNLEERFFSEIDNKLLEKLRSEMNVSQTAEEIIKVIGINDEKLALEIASMQITVETLSAFRLVPLVAVAWADDRVEESERYAVVVAAEKSGIAKESAAMELVHAWTKRRPSPDLLQAWCDYAKALSQSLEGAHREALKNEVMSQVKTVAEAAGGVLGFGSISSSEKAVIHQIEQALS